MKRLAELVRERLGLEPAPLADALAMAARERARSLGRPLEDYLAAWPPAGIPEGEELERLAGYLLLGHTHFYRHEKVWELLAEQLREARGKGTLRALVAGCSTGEEAWTLAMLATEVLGPAALRVIALDVNARSVEMAAAAAYMERDTARLPGHWRSRYLEPAGPGRVRIGPALRSTVEFQRRNLLAGLPAGPFHLALFRNVLIYLTPDAVERVLAALVALLKAPALLVVGPQESFQVSQHPWASPVVEGLPVFRVVRGAPAGRCSPAPHTPSDHTTEAESRAPLPISSATLSAPRGRQPAGNALDSPGSPAGPPWVAIAEPVPLLVPPSTETAAFAAFEAAVERLLSHPPDALTVDLSRVHSGDECARRVVRTLVALLESRGSRVELVSNRAGREAE
jgi:chemotaxis methyl-accepting protein methylase